MTQHAEPAERSQARQAEAERYRAAAEAALGQIDWCITYLRGIGKSAIAASLARNRSEIRKGLR